jgi:hypothetical protein
LADFVYDDGIFTLARGPHDFYCTQCDQEERKIIVARLHQHLSGLDRAFSSMSRDASDLSRIKGWENVLRRFELS